MDKLRFDSYSCAYTPGAYTNIYDNLCAITTAKHPDVRTDGTHFKVDGTYVILNNDESTISVSVRRDSPLMPREISAAFKNTGLRRQVPIEELARESSIGKLCDRVQ